MRAHGKCKTAFALLVLLVLSFSLMVFVVQQMVATVSANQNEEVLIDCNTSDKRSGYWTINYQFPSSQVVFTAVGQSVKIPSQFDGYKLTSVKFFIAKYLTVTGTLQARFYNTNRTHGVNAVPKESPYEEPLAVSDIINMSVLNSSYQIITFTFPDAPYYTLSGDTVYCVCVCAPSYSGVAPAHVQVGSDDTSPVHDGNLFVQTQGKWGSTAAHDAIFYLYGKYVPAPLVTPRRHAQLNEPHNYWFGPDFFRNLGVVAVFALLVFYAYTKRRKT